VADYYRAIKSFMYKHEEPDLQNILESVSSLFFKSWTILLNWNKNCSS